MSTSTIVTLDDLAERARELAEQIERRATEKNSYEIGLNRNTLILFRESLCDLNLGSEEHFMQNDPVLLHKIESAVLRAMWGYKKEFKETHLTHFHLYSILRFEVHTLHAMSRISACKNPDRLYRVYAVSLAFSMINEKPRHPLLLRGLAALQITHQK